MTLYHFNNPGLLAAIGPELLAQFLSFFHDDPLHRDCPLPRLTPGHPVDCEALAVRFEGRSFPGQVCAAAAEIEEAAAADKPARLEKLIATLPASLALPTGLHPVHRSLQLWLWMAQGLIPVNRELFPICADSFAPLPSSNSKPSACDPINPEPSAPDPQSGCSNSDANAPNPAPPAPLSLSAIASLRRNKILHFPSQVVDTIHLLLQKQCTFPEIAAAIGQYGSFLNPSNLSRFKKSRAHRDWLREQRTRDRLQFQVRSVLGVCTDSDPARLQRAAHDAAAVRICQAITACNPAALSQALQQDPATLLSLLKVLPQLTQGAMEIERKSIKINAARKRTCRDANPTLGISEESLRIAREKLNLM